MQADDKKSWCMKRQEIDMIQWNKIFLKSCKKLRIYYLVQKSVFRAWVYGFRFW